MEVDRNSAKRKHKMSVDHREDCECVANGIPEDARGAAKGRGQWEWEDHVNIDTETEVGDDESIIDVAWVPWATGSSSSAFSSIG